MAWALNWGMLNKITMGRVGKKCMLQRLSALHRITKEENRG